MKTKMLTKALEHVDAWPAEAQDQLAEIALEIEAGIAGAEYEPTAEELAGIDRGLRAARTKAGLLRMRRSRQPSPSSAAQESVGRNSEAYSAGSPYRPLLGTLTLAV